tara:strand:+ start:500 stop:604 length:105 start_codon:yes stop_codon:yes gene_type:complete
MKVIIKAHKKIAPIEGMNDGALMTLLTEAPVTTM